MESVRGTWHSVCSYGNASNSGRSVLSPVAPYVHMVMPPSPVAGEDFLVSGKRGKKVEKDPLAFFVIHLFQLKKTWCNVGSNLITSHELFP